MLETFHAVMDRLDGYKTYILVTLAIITLTLGYLGVLSPEAVKIILSYIGFGGVATVAHKIDKVAKDK